MAMRGFRSAQPTSDADRLRQYLDEAFPEGDDKDKLRGLILCVRRRYKGAGYTQEAIAQRARAPVPRINQVIAGEFTRVQWGSIESVLKALDANDTELRVASELYDKVNRRTAVPDLATFGPRRGDLARQPVLQVQPIEVSTPVASPPRASGPPMQPEPVKPDEPAEHCEGLAPIAPVSRPQQAEPAEPMTVIGRGGPAGGEEKRLPGPKEAQTAEEFVKAMKVFRASKGDKPFRAMATHCQHLNPGLEAEDKVNSYTPASFNTIGKNGKLPKLPLVRSYIVGAGGDLDDLELWEKAWSRLAAQLEAAAGSS
jgi:hypothetical protein